MSSPILPIESYGIAAPVPLASYGIAPPSQQKEAGLNQAEQSGGLFASIFQSAIQNVVETDAENTQAQYLLATGQLDNPASAMIAATKYSVAVDMLIQFRNKALDAYSELTRMSI